MINSTPVTATRPLRYAYRLVESDIPDDHTATVDGDQVRRERTRLDASPCGHAVRPRSGGTCALYLPKRHPSSSGGMVVLVQDAAESISSSDVQPGELAGVGDRFGQWFERPGVGDALVGTVLVVERLEFAQRVQQMPLVPDQCSVQQLAAAGPYPPLDDRVHPGVSGHRCA